MAFKYFDFERLSLIPYEKHRLLNIYLQLITSRGCCFQLLSDHNMTSAHEQVYEPHSKIYRIFEELLQGEQRNKIIKTTTL